MRHLGPHWRHLGASKKRQEVIQKTAKSFQEVPKRLSDDLKRFPKGFHEAASAFQEELESKIAVVFSESQKILLPKDGQTFPKSTLAPFS